MATLKPGNYYKIKGLGKTLPIHYRHKLLSVGLVPGACFYVVRHAPLGNTLQITLNGFNLSLRAKELEQVIFELL